jgi:hypothetical protein
MLKFPKKINYIAIFTQMGHGLALMLARETIFHTGHGTLYQMFGWLHIGIYGWCNASCVWLHR